MENENLKTGFSDLKSLPTVDIDNNLVKYARHHAIAETVFLDPNNRAFFQALKSSGLFDPNSFASNGVPLPRTPSSAAITEMAYHAGGHPAYVEWERDFIDKFGADFTNKNFGDLSETDWLEARARDINGFKAFVQTELMDPNSPFALVAKDLPPPDVYNNLPAEQRAALQQQFDRITLDDIRASRAYQIAASVKNGAQFFDATPGSGTAFDINQKLTGTALADAIQAEATKLGQITDLINGDPAARALAESVSPSELKNFGASDFASDVADFKVGHLTVDTFKLRSGVRTIFSSNLLHGVKNALITGATVGLILVIAREEAEKTGDTLQASLSKMGVTFSEETLMQIGGEVATDFAISALLPFGVAKKAWEAYQSSGDAAGLIDLAARWKPDNQALQSLNSFIKDLRSYVPDVPFPDFDDIKNLFGPPAEVGHSDPIFRIDPISGLPEETTYNKQDVGKLVALMAEGIIPGDTAGRIAPDQLAKLGELARTGALPANIVKDFARGVANGQVSAFSERHVQAAAAIAPRLTPNSVVEFIAGRPQDLTPSNYDTQAAAWDIVKSIRDALAVGGSNIADSVSAAVRDLTSRLASANEAIATLPLLELSRQQNMTGFQAWDAARRALDLLGVPKPPETVPPESSAKYNSLVDSGVPPDMAKKVIQSPEPVAPPAPTNPPPSNSDPYIYQSPGPEVPVSNNTHIWGPPMGLGGPKELASSEPGSNGNTTYREQTDLNDGSTVSRSRTLGTEPDSDTGWIVEVHTPRHVVDIALPDPEVLSGAQIGEVFGAALGQVIGGSNTFVRVAAGSVLGTVLGMVGSTFDLYSRGFKVFNDGTTEALSLSEAVYEAAGDFDARLEGAFASAGISAVSSFLTAELNLPEGFGGQLGSVVANSLINKAITNIVSHAGDVTKVFDGFTGEIFLPHAEGGFLTGGIGFTTGVAVSSFIGSYLANKVAPAQTLAGSIGSSIGSSLGTLAGLAHSVVSTVAGALAIAAGTVAQAILSVVLPGIGAFIGAVLGAKIGDLISGIFEDSDWAWITVGVVEGQSTVKRIAYGIDSTPLFRNVETFADSALGVANQVIAAIGGTVVGDNSLEMRFKNVDGKLTISLTETNSASGRLLRTVGSGGLGGTTTVDGDINPSYSKAWAPGRDATAEFDASVIQMLKRITVVGGDAYMKAALSQSTATTIEALGRQLSTAEAFSKILAAFENLVDGKLAGVTTPNFNVSLASTAAAEAMAKSLALVALKQATVTSDNRYAKAALEQSTAVDLDLLERQIRVALNYSAALEAVGASFGGKITGNAIPNFNQAFATDADIEAFIETTAIAQIKATAATIAGGDIYVKRALAATKATTLDVLSGDIAVALDFGRYLANKDIIDAVVAQNPDSAFAAGWVITLLKASELRLDQAAASDFAGGVAGFVKGIGVERYGASLADVSFAVNGTSLIMTIADPSGGPGREIDISNYAARTGLALRASAAVSAGTTGKDLWFAPTTGGTFTDAAGASSGDDVLIGKQGADTINGGAGHDYIDAGAGNDTVAAGAGDDVVKGGAGNDTLDGGAGDDTYVFDRGDGKDTLREVVMGTKTVTTTTTRQDETRTPFTVDKFVPADIVKLGNNFSGYTYAIKVQNGKSYTTIPLPDGAFDPREALGGATAGYFIKETRYVVRDHTVEVVTNSTVAAQVDGGRDTLRFGSDISIADLFLTTSASDMIIGLRETDAAGAAKPVDQLANVVSIAGWSNPLSRVENLVFADGMVVDIGGISRAVSTSDSADTLTGTAGGDFLSGGAGNDVFQGSAGSDIFVGGAGSDTADYTAMTTKVSVDLTTGLVTKTGGGTDRLFGVESFRGTTGDDTITGNDVGNALSGGKGNDKLSGGVGNDSYWFARGHGQDTIANGDSVASSWDRMVFSGGNITSENLLFSRLGDDLSVQILGTTDSVTFSKWFADASARIDVFQATDGRRLLASDVGSLVNAMASFSPTAAANASVTSTTQMAASVQTAVNAVWHT